MKGHTGTMGEIVLWLAQIVKQNEELETELIETKEELQDAFQKLVCLEEQNRTSPNHGRISGRPVINIPNNQHQEEMELAKVILAPLSNLSEKDIRVFIKDMENDIGMGTPCPVMLKEVLERYLEWREGR